MRCAISSAEQPITTAASLPSVSWSCSPPKPAMLGYSIPPIGSRHGWLETARTNRSTSRKPIPRSPSVGRAATASRDWRSFTPIEIPAGSPPSSAIRPRGSLRPSDLKISNIFLITHYSQPSRHGTKQEHTAVSAGLIDGAQQGAISKGPQRGAVCCSLRNRGSVPGGGDALALAIRLCLPGLRREASQLRQDPGALPVYRLSTADIGDRRNDFRGDQGAAVHLVSCHVPPHSEQGRHLQH